MEGRLQGKRLTARALPRRGARARRRGLQLPARGRRRHGHRRRLRDVLVGAGLRRLRDEARPRDAAPGPVARGHGDGDGRPPAGTTARRRRWPRRARSCAASSSGSPSAAGSPNAGTELEFIVFKTPTRRPGARRYRDLEPANLYNVDYSLLGTARVEPLIRRIRNEMAGAGMTVENSKGECNLGQHEINFRYADGARDRRRPRDLQERRQGDRRPGGHGDHLHGEVQRARGQLVPHPLLARRRATASNVFAADRDAVRPLHRRPARLHARDDAVLRAARQLLQALRPAARSRRPRSPGATTTAPARCGSSATARRCGSRTGCPAPTSTPTWRSRR